MEVQQQATVPVELDPDGTDVEGDAKWEGDSESDNASEAKRKTLH